MKTSQYVGSALALFSTFCGNAQTTLTKVTTGPIATDQGQFIRGVWADFSKSGFLDLFVCAYDGTNVFYRNNGNGSFTKITQGNPVIDRDYHIVPDAGDYDNDGTLDLLVSAGVAAPRHNALFHNDGRGNFMPVSGGGMTSVAGYYDVLSWVDYDNDGRLDFYVSQDGVANNLLWHNEGEGVFSRVGSSPLVTTIGGSPTWGDYDNDGRLDLLLVLFPASSHNVLYHNEGGGVFRQVRTNVLAMDFWPGGAQSAAWGDYDNDGFLDLFGSGAGSGIDRLYRNNHDGTFTSITNGITGTRPDGADSFGCAWGDYDNDGYLDLFVTRRNAPNALYHNNGDGTFTEILDGDPVNDGGPEYSACGWVDYDNDGSLDLFVSQNNLDVPAVSNLLYHNSGNSNAWLEVRLVGKASNGAGIGAKVRAKATIGGKPLSQIREVTGGAGLWMQTLTAHFGLGDASSVDDLRVEWPSGIVQVITNVAARQILTLTEHQQGVTAVPHFTNVSRSADGSVTLSIAGPSGLTYVVEGSSDLAKWTWLGALSNPVGTIQFTDQKATNYPVRFYRASIP